MLLIRKILSEFVCMHTHEAVSVSVYLTRMIDNVDGVQDETKIL